MKIIGINGISTHGKNNTDRMLQRLADLGHQTCDVHLPKRWAFTARWKAKDDAKTILEFADPGDVIVAHSFGCLRAAKAMEQVDPGFFRAAFMFRPAMSTHYDFKGRTRDTRTFCFFSPDDLAILVGSLLIAHPFGAAGRKGFKDSYVANVHSYGAHNADFEGPGLRRNSKFIDGCLMELE